MPRTKTNMPRRKRPPRATAAVPAAINNELLGTNNQAGLSQPGRSGTRARPNQLPNNSKFHPSGSTGVKNIDRIRV